MQWVRKRRFRRRVNRRHIERVEADVEELIARDREWEKEYPGGDSQITLEYVDPDAPAEDELDAEGEDEDYGFEYEDQDGNVYVQEPVAMDEEEDDDELAAALEAGLAGDDDDQEVEQTATLVAEPSMLHASPDSLVPIETAITPGSGATMSATEDSGDDDEDDEDDEVASDEEDEDEKAQRQEREQALAEVEETKKEIAEWEEKLKKQFNPLLKAKIKGNLDKLKADLQVKLSGLGLDEDE
jgi:transcription initiation factor TFIID subunit 7